VLGPPPQILELIAAPPCWRLLLGLTNLLLRKDVSSLPGTTTASEDVEFKTGEGAGGSRDDETEARSVDIEGLGAVDTESFFDGTGAGVELRSELTGAISDATSELLLVLGAGSEGVKALMPEAEKEEPPIALAGEAEGTCDPVEPNSGASSPGGRTPPGDFLSATGVLEGGGGLKLDGTNALAVARISPVASGAGT